ncbi:MAG: hypothetical protein ACRDUA_12605 [Micromonosporaceae bacterium]
MNVEEGPSSEGPLAEFAAMRQAIESCIERMTKLHLFQLSTAGAIFAFVMSGKGRAGLLLIVPVSSYLLHSSRACPGLGYHWTGTVNVPARVS